MNCYLCLQESEQLFDIHKEIEQENYKFTLFEAISKYFSFKPPITETSVCVKCRDVIKPFHIFCLQIEETYKQVIALKKKLNPDENKLEDNHERVRQNDNKVKPVKVKLINNIIECDAISIKEEDQEIDEEVTCVSEDANIIPKQEIDIGETELVDAVSVQNNIESDYNLCNTLSILKQEDYSTTNYSDQSEYNMDNKFGQYYLTHPNSQNGLICEKKLKINNRSKIRDKRRKERTDLYINRKISKFMKLKCDICNEKISTFKDLQKHFEWQHREPGYAICCGMRFYKRYLLVHHIDFHLSSVSSRNKIHYKQNSVDERNFFKYEDKDFEDKRKLQCNQCEKTFSRVWTLKQHQAYHTPKGTWKFKCEDCKKTLPTHCHLNSHIYFAHKGRNIQCHICYETIRAALLNKHLKNHPKEEKGRSENEQEQSEYDEYEQVQSEYDQTEKNSQLESEDDSLEQEIKHYACSTCNELFISENILNMHIIEEHS